MAEKNIAEMLSKGGGYNLPYLIHITAREVGAELFLVNDNVNLTYEHKEYCASSFTYTPNDDGSAQLEIALVDNPDFYAILDGCRQFNVDVVGVLNDGEVMAIRQYKHRYGEGDWTEKSLTLKLNKDDRLEMTFPALKFSSDNNRGNT